jgi:mono/diheme cytochrome c family protein
MSPVWPRAILGLIICAAPACDESQVWHEMNPTLARMQDQRRATPYGETAAFPDESVMRPPPPGTVPRGVPESPWIVNGAYVARGPIPVDRALLERGRDRFEITCAACHGILGDADSVVASKMQLRKPRSLQDPAVRAYPDGRIYEIILQGYGLMPAYDSHLSSAEDRWAVIAYIRALQLSQNATAHELPPDLQDDLARLPR